jgi:hypothetical protein
LVDGNDMSADCGEHVVTAASGTVKCDALL